MLKPKLKYAASLLRHTNWIDDLRRIGQGIVIAGVATPALSSQSSIVNGTLTAFTGFILIVIAKLKEA